MTRLAGASRLLRVRRARNAARSHPAYLSAAALEAEFAANIGRLHRFIVARGAAAHMDDILRWVHHAISVELIEPSLSPGNAMLGLAERWIAERRLSRSRDAPFAVRNLAALAGAKLDALDERAAAVFRRHRIDGISQQAVACEFGVDLAMVQHDLRRAYTALADPGELATRQPEDDPRTV